MSFLHAPQDRDALARRRAARARHADSACPSATSCSALRSSRPSRTTPSAPCSAWAASGAPSAIFWQAPGVYTTAVGYAGGLHAQPHLRGGLLAGAPATTRSCSWCSARRRSPTRSCCGSSGRATTRPRACARATTWAPSTAPASTPPRRPRPRRREASRDAYAERLSDAGYGEITTEIEPAGEFYYAEDYHQQYLAKNPNGYCGIGGTGVSCPVGVAGV